MGCSVHMTSYWMHTYSLWSFPWCWSHCSVISRLSGWTSRTVLLEAWGGRYQYVCPHCIAQHLHNKWSVVVAIDTDVIMMCINYITHMDGLQELWVKKMDIYLPARAIVDVVACLQSCRWSTERPSVSVPIRWLWGKSGCYRRCCDSGQTIPYFTVW